MVRLATLAASAAAALALVASAGAACSTPEQAAESAARAFIARDWPALWAGYSPHFRAVCDHDRWLAAAKANRATFGHGELKLIVTGVWKHGDRARLAYVWSYQGHPTAFDGDLYVRVGGRWYDELDQLTTCLG